ncbi:MAG: hypothetical protein HGN29_10255 [Asgard group archaeon]|nr:hypothetical protein [Asgard group archaeon]
MKLTRLIFKAKKKILLVELFIIIAIFLVSSLSFTYYLNSYRTEWIGLVNSHDEPDLQIELTQPFWVFLEGKDDLNEELENFQYLAITSLPSHLFKLVFENITIEDYNLYILNSEILEFFGYDLSGNETLLTTTYENNIDSSEITANFVLQSGLSNTTITDIFNQTLLYSAIFGSRNIEHLSTYANTSLILSESYFNNLLSSIDEATLLNITQNFLTHSFYTFSWNKSELINALPSKLFEIHKEWNHERIAVFSQMYIPNYVRYEEFNISANQIFSDKISDLLTELDSILISTIIILFFLSLTSIIFLFQFLRSRTAFFSKISLILSSRGLKGKSVKSRFLVLHSSTLLFSITLFFGFVLILLYSYELIMWNYSYLVIGVSTSIVFFSLLTMQIKLVQTLDIQTKTEGTKKSSRSRSQIIDFGLKLGLGLVIFIASTSILSFNQWFLNIFSITISTLWIITCSLSGVIVLILLLPTLISKLIIPLTKLILRNFSHFHSAVSRLFEQLARQKRIVWTSIFFLQMLFSLIIIGPNLFITHQEQTELSSYCYNVSLVVETESVSEIQDLVWNKPSMIAYVEPIYISQFQRRDIYIYLDDPMAFFNGVHFFGNYFKKRSSSQVFTMLSSSKDFFVTTRFKADEGQFSIGDLVSLYKKDVNGSNIEEKKILLDIVDFLPFFSIFFDEEYMNIFLMKYDESTHILNKNHYAIFSFQAEQEAEEENFFTNLKEENLMFNVIHSFSQSTLIQNTQPSFVLKVLKLPIYFLIVLIPSLVFLLFFDVRKRGTESFSFLIRRGFRGKNAKSLTFYWFFILSIFLTLISFLYSVLVLLPMIFILNLTYIMPMRLTINWISLLIVIPILFSVFMFPVSIKEDSKIKSHLMKKRSRNK